MYRDEYGLTIKRRDFADRVVSGENQRDAYFTVFSVANIRTAGFHGARLMKVPDVRNYIDLRRNEVAKNIGVDQEWVRQRLVRIIEYGMNEEEVVHYWSQGKGRPEKEVKRMRMVDINQARLALEFLGGDVGLGKGAGGDRVTQITPVTAVFIGLPNR